MFIRLQDASVRSGDNFEIRNYLTSAVSDCMSLASVSLNGPHPRSLNNKSDRVCFILEGTAVVEVGSEQAEVQPGDAVYIPKGTPHSISGNVRYLVLNVPPYDRAAEVAL